VRDSCVYFSTLSLLRAKPYESCRAQVRGFAEERIAHDIEIGIAGEAEAGAESGAAGFFDVDEKFGGIVEAYAGVEGHDAGRRFLVVGAKAMGAAVVGRERGMIWKMKFA